MPFLKRLVEPTELCRDTLPADTTLPSELEAVTNGTLTHVVRQLSSLSRHAEDMFGELFREAERIVHRSASLQLRIDSLADKVTRLDSTVEEVSLQEIHMRKAFRSQVVKDQEVVSRQSMPDAMLQTYLGCDKPPPLDELNVFRNDGKDGLKFYTDPNYFFELWRQDMLKENERLMSEKGRKPHRPRHDGSAGSSGGRHKKRVRQAQNTRERQRQAAEEHGEYITPPSHSSASRPAPPPPPPAPQHAIPYDCDSPSELEPPRPPPPPPPPGLGSCLVNGFPKTALDMDNDPAEDGGKVKLTPVTPAAAKPPPLYDARSDLLKAIRDGITLRKVEVVEEQRREQAQPLHDVASILARRVAIEVSSDTESDSDSDSECWDDETSA
ncbi:wiskott-Aldrich syndrome protein family member 3-like [Pollicipes pollicipes]|uniref:wiskott-Aldrich syndrome protein family member 3-like n=1 Tax=Pollicipes pollicipes TaxID=41117 RepID=UPI001884B4C3|nr:wiskott-Aldrich syndrome protein family member 3-like [Pollicipes pollicipes]XP_037079335.1 wiskott-Aldrich syndrome protein family member 3-like [Pollicipes pollicipes]